jgi:hypothetical protein
MSNWTPKQAFSELMSKFRRSDSDESSSYSSDEDVADVSEEDESALVSPLVLMNENSSEAWLGQFLLMLELGGVTRYGTIQGAKRDTDLQDLLRSLMQAAARDVPSPLFDSLSSEELKRRDWASWWRSQNALTRYCYSALSLSMLGDMSHIDDLAAMYAQNANSRVQRDSHYVLCYLLGKEWPVYDIKPSDIDALRQRSSSQTQR